MLLAVGAASSAESWSRIVVSKAMCDANTCPTHSFFQAWEYKCRLSPLSFPVLVLSIIDYAALLHAKGQTSNHSFNFMKVYPIARQFNERQVEPVGEHALGVSKECTPFLKTQLSRVKRRD